MRQPLFIQPLFCQGGFDSKCRIVYMDLLIIHGYKLTTTGKVDPVLKKRLDFGIQLIIDNPSIGRVLLTGGESTSGFAESDLMYEYMIHNGVNIPIQKESKSLNTVQNVLYSRKLVLIYEYNKIYIVIGKRMEKRAKLIYKKVLPELIEKIFWLTIDDGYMGHFELLWFLSSVGYLSLLKFVAKFLKPLALIGR